MARPLFEQYKDALRRGHVALLGDELDTALEAYREAARLVPDRPLPYASIGDVLARLNRPAEAIQVYDQALALGPDDPAVADARATLLAAMPEPVEAATPAEEAEPAPPIDAAPAEPPPPEPAMSELPVGAAATGDQSPPVGDAAGPTDAPDGADAADAAGAAGAADGGDPQNGAWPAIDLPSLPEPAIEGPPPDPLVLEAEATACVDAGDLAAARDLWLTAVAVHRAEGRLDAAIDACLELLGIAPGDPRVHLAIANLQLDRGWDQVATEKIELLLRLTSLSGDAQAEADVHLLAAERLRDESPTRLDARRRGLPAA